RVLHKTLSSPDIPSDDDLWSAAGHPPHVDYSGLKTLPPPPAMAARVPMVITVTVEGRGWTVGKASYGFSVCIDNIREAKWAEDERKTCATTIYCTNIYKKSEKKDGRRGNSRLLHRMPRHMKVERKQYVTHHVCLELCLRSEA
ncbi:hypothetical protein M8C21_022576, partial [Ambrosia artemisiifolia]